jgi:hypothetical protein
VRCNGKSDAASVFNNADWISSAPAIFAEQQQTIEVKKLKWVSSLYFMITKQFHKRDMESTQP